MDQPKILTIIELNRYIRTKFEQDQLLTNVCVAGEISNFTHHSSRHMYFTLKDKESRIRTIMFASHNQRLGFLPKEGMKVVVQGNVSVYERDGQYQLYATSMQPDGIGALYLAYEQLKAKLEQEGLFSNNRKRPIPRIPKTVGVITSPTGAAVRDICITLGRRFPYTNILVYPVLVQGMQAAPSIARAIEIMNQLNEADVLIVGRGGGSLEELWAFNEEVVARAIANSQIPIISAVGHETDFTISDFVADLRAATPTAAAELAVPHAQEMQQHLLHLKQRLWHGTFHFLRERKERLTRLSTSSVFTQPQRTFLQHAERIDRWNEKLKFSIFRRLSQSKDRFIQTQHRIQGASPQDRLELEKKEWRHYTERLQTLMSYCVKEKVNSFQTLLKQLDALSPLKVLGRGYTLSYHENTKKLVKSIDQVQLGDLIRIQLHDGSLQCSVWSMQEEENT